MVRGRHAERSANCLDRHLAARGDQVAIIWEGDDPNSRAKSPTGELHEQVCRWPMC
jgi:acetyl-CoA synthetase